MADNPADPQVWRQAMAANGLEAGFAELLGWGIGPQSSSGRYGASTAR